MAASQLLPLLFLLMVTAIIGYVLYHAYITSRGVQQAASERISKRHHIELTKEGAKVSVKDLNTEKYVDGTQKFVVKAWNLSGHGPEPKKRKSAIDKMSVIRLHAAAALHQKVKTK